MGLFRELFEHPSYKSNKPACCSIFILKAILVCASDLNSVLFAFVMFEIFLFYFILLFFYYFIIIIIFFFFCLFCFQLFFFFRKTPFDAAKAPREHNKRRDSASITP